MFVHRSTVPWRQDRPTLTGFSDEKGRNLVWWQNAQPFRSNIELIGGVFPHLCGRLQTTLLKLVAQEFDSGVFFLRDGVGWTGVEWCHRVCILTWHWYASVLWPKSSTWTWVMQWRYWLHVTIKCRVIQTPVPPTPAESESMEMRFGQCPLDVLRFFRLNAIPPPHTHIQSICWILGVIFGDWAFGN